jgi:small-conductance mechanosensitive channel
LWIVAIATILLFGGAAFADPPPAAPGHNVIDFLEQTVDWYRRVSALDENAVTTQELLYRDAARQHARDAVRLAFQFARADAAMLSDQEKVSSTTNPGNPSRDARLSHAADVAEKRVADVRAQLDQVNQQIAKADPASLPVLTARRDKLSSQLELAIARRDVLKNFSGFMSDSAAGSAAGLLARIDELERSVPEVQAESDQPGNAEPKTSPPKSGPAAPAAAPQEFHPESAGIFALLNATFTLPGQLNELKGVADQADTLVKLNQTLAAPIRKALMDAIHQADAIAAVPDTDDPAKLDEQRQQLDALAISFKQLSATAVPLREQEIVLGATATSLTRWRRALEVDYTSAVRYLAVRLGAMTLAIVVLLGISKLWRHATFRYIGDIRRRRQFLVVRRMVVSIFIALIIMFTFVTEFGSLATFAGILTAGIAVALQTFIVSGVAYFFFVGRYGVRVGERVTISNITGDVMEIGLFRLYLMELGGTGLDRQPTGRIVVFSNSVLFQPAAFFKQVPGADYTWHQVSLTLAPGSDYQAAERRLVAAVESVFAEYQADIDRQHEAITQWIHVPVPKPRPEGRLRFMETGVELVIRYPVDIRRAPEIDELLGRRLLEEINTQPVLKLLGSGMPRIQAAD